MSLPDTPITYKKLTYGHNQLLALTEETIDPSSNLQPNQILVKVASAAINPIDLLLYETHKYVFLSRSVKQFGRDFSGVVLKAGSSVDRFQVGDKISGIIDQEGYQSLAGSFSEYVTLDVTKNLNIGFMPSNLTWNEAASFNLVLGTAWTLFTHHHKPTSKSRVLVIGGGTSVGLYAIQLLKNYFNVESIISVNSGKSELTVRGAGADYVVDYKTVDDPAQKVLTLVHDEFNGEKLDLICDCVGSNQFFGTIDQILKPKSEKSGYVTIVGDEVIDYTKAVNPFKMAFNAASKLLIPRCYNYKISGIQHGGWYEIVKGFLEKGIVQVRIQSVVNGLENWKDVVGELEDHQAQGKIVLEIDGTL